jgi:hypothetical protein
MLFEEAAWLGDRIAVVPDERLFPLLNVGSSTEAFRRVAQPHIDEQIFRPLRRRGGRIVHLDIKDAPGVDVVGSILDRQFVKQVRENVAPRSVLASNLLEHVPDPRSVARALASLVEPDGLMIVSGPRHYPYHPDPIDNHFRPSLSEVHALFPATHLLDAAIIPSDTWRPWSQLGAGRLNAFVYFCRLALPLYRPKAWRRRIDSFPYFFRRASAYAALLEKHGAAATVVAMTEGDHAGGS